MSMFKSQVRFSGDPAKCYQLSRQREPLAPIRLFVQRDPFFSANEVFPGVPWGLLVPGEAVVDRGATSARIDPQSSPPGSTFFVKYEVEEGDSHEQSLLYIGTEPMLAFFVPQELLMAAMGKRVSVGYEVEWPDGTRVQGPGTSFRVQLPLEIPPIQIEGVGYGEPLDPSQLPERIILTVDRIRNLESFHNARLRVMVNGVKDGFMGPVLDYHFPLDNASDGPVSIDMLRWWLTYPYETGWTDVGVDFLFRNTMLPPPNTTDDWGNFTRIGMNSVVPPSTR